MVLNKKENKILAKPSGVTLKEHTANVMAEGKYIEQSLPVLFQKYEKRVGKSLGTRLQIVCKHHDDGKRGDIKWQEACQKDNQAYKDWLINNSGTFKDYSRAVGEDAGKNIRKAATRHEFTSLNQFDIKNTPAYIFTAVAAHHGKLSIKETERWKKEGAQKHWDYFNKLDWTIKDNFSFLQALTSQYELAGPRGLLQFADHRASAKEDWEILPELKSFSYEFPHPEKRGVQKIVEMHWQDNLLLVRAPTGAGKTDAALLWASLQIQNKRAERLVIAMPTRFTSNALEINVAESLSETGLYHSSAWFNKFQGKVNISELTENEAKKNHEFARLLHTPITVCTIDHLLMSMTLMREDHHQITFNLANSCLVIDEADFYDDFTQANILTLLEALKEWQVPVLLMSASLPESVILDYKKIGFRVDNILEDTSDNNRERFNIESIMEFEELSEIEHLLELCIEKEAAIIYANTVDKAMLLYDYFEKRGAKAIVYHSRFTEPHKKEKEEQLINHLGKTAWQNGNAKGIAILTQIGEMSINISADLMISEICPIDRLTQRAGRLCRFEINGKHNVGELHIIIPNKNGLIYPAPYGSYDRKEKSWIPAETLLKTIDKIELKYYNATLLVTLLNSIFEKESSFSAKAKRNAKKLKELFISNWLINPLYKSATADTDGNGWTSRDIPPQDTLFVSSPKCKFFYNYILFQEWKIMNSIEVPVYLIEKYRKENIVNIETIYIKDDEEKILVINESNYCYEKGIYISRFNMFWE